MALIDFLDFSGNNLFKRDALNVRAQMESAVRAELHLLYGKIFVRIDRPKEAEKHLRRALSNYREGLGRTHQKTMSALIQLAALLSRKEDTGKEAQEMLEEALAEFLNVRSSDDPAILIIQRNLGSVLRNQGKLEKALAILEQTLRILERVDSLGIVETDNTLKLLSEVSYEMGDLQKAEHYANRLFEFLRSSAGHGPGHWKTLEQLHNLAILKKIRGELSEAREIAVQVYDGMRRTKEFKSRRSVWLGAMTSLSRASILLDLGKFDRAEKYAREAIELEEERGESPVFRADVLRNRNTLIRVLLARNKLKEAGEQIEIVANDKNLNSRLALVLKDNRAALLEKQGKYAEAEMLLTEVLEEARRMFAPGHWRTAFYQLRLAECLTKANKFDLAERAFMECHEALKSSMGTEAPAVKRPLIGLVRLYEKMGKPEEAARYRARLGEAGIHRENGNKK